MAMGENLNPLYKTRYLKLCDLLANTFWAPTSAGRTVEEQEVLYNSGRTTDGPIVTNAAPGFSAHNYGCATDWAEYCPDFSGKEIWDKADWKRFAGAVAVAKLRWGGDWNANGKKDKNDWDLAHCELPIRISWAKVGAIYRARGMEGAKKAIWDNLIGGDNG